MGIEYIGVKNFTVFKGSHKIFLGNRMIFCRGVNGAGKTTLFVDIPAFALYGPDAISHRGKRDELISQGMRESYVELAFTYKSPQGQSSKYVVRRNITKDGGSTAELVEITDSREVRRADTVKEVNNKIIELLGMDQKTFRSTVVIRQGEVEILSEASPSERRNLFLNIFNINFDPLREKIKEEKDRLEKENEKLSSNLSLIKRELEKETTLQGTLLQLETTRKIIEKELNDVETAYERLSQDEKNLRSKIGILEELRKQVDDKKRRIESLKNDVNINEMKIKEIEKKLEETINIDAKIEIISRELEILRKYNDTYKDLEKSKELLESSLKQAIKEYDNIKKEVSKISEIEYQLNRIKNDEEELNEIEKNYDELSNENTIITRELSEYKAKLNEILNHKNILMKTDNEKAVIRCPVCGSELSVQKRNELIEKYEEEISGLNYHIEYLEEKQKEKDHEIKILEKRKKELILRIGSKNQLMERLNDLIEKKKILEDLEREIAQKQKDLEEIKNKISELNQSLLKEIKSLTTINPQIIRQYVKSNEEELERLRKESNERSKLEIELIGLKEKVNERKKELENLSKEYQDIENNIKDYETLKRELESLTLKLNELRKKLDENSRKIGEIDGRIKEIKDSLSQLEQKHKEYEEIETKLKEIENELKIYKALDNIFMERNFPAKIISYYVKRVEYYAQEYINLFLGNRFTLKLNVDYGGINAVVQEGATQRKLEALSMGERTAIGFALRLGIMSAVAEQHGLRRPDFLIIDEGLSALDEEKRNAFLDILGKLKENFSTVVVISHIGELADAPIFDMIVTIEREGAQSTIKIENNKIQEF
ncbi:MAG: AAA family ATPase [Thermoprotei archaeon]